MMVSYDIASGASREELFDAARLRHEGRTASFTHKGSRFVQAVRINAIRSLDNDGDMWVVDGFVPNDPRAPLVRVIFSTRTRTGRIQVWIDECMYCAAKMDDRRVVCCNKCGEQMR